MLYSTALPGATIQTASIDALVSEVERNGDVPDGKHSVSARDDSDPSSTWSGVGWLEVLRPPGAYRHTVRYCPS